MAAPESTTGSLSVQVTFVMDSQPRYLSIVRAAVGQLAAVAGWSEGDARAIVLAIDEALANIIRHAYHGRPDGRVELECRAAGDELQFLIRDFGEPPDPARICARAIGCDQVGGLGTHIIRDVMDTVSYQATPEGNRFTAAKRLRRTA